MPPDPPICLRLRRSKGTLRHHDKFHVRCFHNHVRYFTKLLKSLVLSSMSRGLYQNTIYMALMFFSLGQTEEWFISGKMLSASNGLNALFALFFLFSFTEISQGSENQPKNGVDGMYGLNSLFYGINISVEFFRSMYLFLR